MWPFKKLFSKPSPECVTAANWEPQYYVEHTVGSRVSARLGAPSGSAVGKYRSISPGMSCLGGYGRRNVRAQDAGGAHGPVCTASPGLSQTFLVQA